MTAVRSDLVRVVLAVLAVNLILLMLFLRALIAPVLLVASGALSVAAALGITTWMFQTVLGYHELTYYVPFAAGVLLVSLGSDYNVFVAGRVWQEARVRPLRDALRLAPARTTAAIRTAGITLATSFALLAIVDVRAFRELAFAMAVGILLETFVVRPFLVPALLSLFGELSGWPGGRLARGAGVVGRWRLTSSQPRRSTRRGRGRSSWPPARGRDRAGRLVGRRAGPARRAVHVRCLDRARLLGDHRLQPRPGPGRRAGRDLVTRAGANGVAAAGLAVFALASAACTVAGSFDLLLAARCVQAASGAVVVCAALRLLPRLLGSPARGGPPGRAPPRSGRRSGPLPAGP